MAKEIVNGLMYVIRAKHLRGVARTNAYRMAKETGQTFEGYQCVCTADMAREGVAQGYWEAHRVKVAPLRLQGLDAAGAYAKAQAAEAGRDEGP